MLSFMSINNEVQRVHNKGHVSVTVSPPSFLLALLILSLPTASTVSTDSPVGESLYVVTVSGFP